MKTYEDADGYAEIENHYGTWQDGLIDQLEFEGSYAKINEEIKNKSHQ